MSGFGLELDYTLQWQSSWHVGSGYGSAAVDRVIRRRGPSGRPYVPGSQIKGVLRHECERLAASVGAEVVDPHATNRDQRRALAENFDTLSSSKLVVDRLFGTRREGECLFVSDARGTTGVTERSGTVVPRTAIDRVTGTVRHQRLFTTEVVDDDTRLLEGQIRGWHAEPVVTQEDESGFPFEYGLLVAGLLHLGQLGGDKSVGRGRCRLSELMIRWKGPATAWAEISPDHAMENLKLGAGSDGWIGYLNDFRGDL